MSHPSCDMTVILPTRNRADQLQGALERLAAQQTGGAFTYEVLIVDNGSTDATRQVVEAWQPRFPVPLRYLYEGRPGKPWALNSGMAAAHGAIFAFTDDDILTTPTWLAALWRCFQEEKADGVGGKILPQWTAPRPAWLTDEAFRKFGGLGCVDHGDRRRSSATGSYCRWVGGSFAVRRQAAERLGPYDPTLLRGEDTEYYERAINLGLTVCYEPAALAAHRIAADRMTLDYFRQVRHKTGYYRVYRMPWTAKDLLTVVPLWWYLDALKTAGLWLHSIAVRSRWVDRFAYELAVREKAGFWVHRLRWWPRWWLTMLTGKWLLPHRGPSGTVPPMQRSPLRTLTVTMGALLGIIVGLYLLIGKRLISAAYAGTAPEWLSGWIRNRAVPLDGYLQQGRLRVSRAVLVLLAGYGLTAAVILRQRVAARLRTFFTEPDDALNLAVFRVVVFGLLWRAVDVDQLLWWSRMPAALQMPPWGSAWLLRIVPVNETWVHATAVALAWCAGLAMVGAATRLTAPAAAALAVYVLGVPQWFGKVNHNSHHLVWFAALLAVSRCADTLSIDAVFQAWRRADAGTTEPPAPSRAYAMPLRIVWLLFGVLFLFPGFWKWWVSGIEWVWSDNLKWWMYNKWAENNHWRPAWRLDQIPLLCRLGALGAVAFELGFLWAMFLPRLRTVWAVAGVGFHQANMLLMKISFVLLQACYAAFVPWARAARALGRRLFPHPLFVVYDGHCRLCRRTIASLRTLDWLERIVYVNAHEEAALRRHGLDRLDRQALMTDMHAVAGGRSRRGYGAYQAIAWRVPLLWPLAPILAIPLVAALGRQIYRRVADSRTCELAHHAQLARAAAQPPAAQPLSPAVIAVGAVLLAGNLYCGVRQLNQAWPFACYPTFSRLARPVVSVIEVEVVETDGSTRRLDDRGLKRQTSGARWKGMIRQVLLTEDQGRRRARLGGVWILWAREEPALRTVRTVRFYETIRSIDPDRIADPPLEERLLWETNPTELEGTAS